MRWLFLCLLPLSAWAACTPRTGYSFCATLTQVHTQNGASDSANFPVGVIGTANGTGTGAFSSSNVDLRVTGSGGKIQHTVTSANVTVPADFVFTSDSSGVTLLNWEVASYTGTTGAVEAYVNLSISHTSDTLFYISFGNASVSTFQGNIASTWNSAFKAIIHNDNVTLASGKVTAANDSTSNNNSPSNASSTLVQHAGIAGNALSGANGSQDQLKLAFGSVTGFATGSGTRTLEVWWNRNGTSAGAPQVVTGWGGAGGSNQLYAVFSCDAADCTATQANGAIWLFGNNGHIGTGGPATDSNWHYSAYTYPTGQTTVGQTIGYYDGAVQTINFGSSGATLNTSLASGGDGFNIGKAPSSGTEGCCWNGYVDEIRVSNVQRSADWITATFNNFNTPGSFVTISNAGTATPPPPFGIINQ